MSLQGFRTLQFKIPILLIHAIHLCLESWLKQGNIGVQNVLKRTTFTFLRCGHTSPDSSNERLTDKKKMRIELRPLLSGGENRNLSSPRHPRSKYETHKTHNDRTTTERAERVCTGHGTNI